MLGYYSIVAAIKIMEKETKFTIPETKKNLNDRKHQPQHSSKFIPSSSSKPTVLTKKTHYPKRENSATFSPRGVIAFSIKEKNEVDVQEDVTNNVLLKVVHLNMKVRIN